jgi:hypothetical protein
MSEIKDLIKEIKKIKRGRTVWSSKTVQAQTRALRSEWTPEMTHDLSQYSGIDSSIEDALIKEIYNNLTDDDRDLFQLYGIKV